MFLPNPASVYALAFAFLAGCAAGIALMTYIVTAPYLAPKQNDDA